MTERVFTSLKEVYECLGDVACELIMSEHPLYRIRIGLDMPATEGRLKKLKDLLEDDE